MKMFLFGFMAIVLMSCLHMYRPPEFLGSPSRLYKLTATINEDVNKSKWECVVLTLYDSSYRKINTLQTGASNNMKWAADWYKGRDTIILNSKDIGVYAWRISNKKTLTLISVTNDIEVQANLIFERKYASQNN